MNRAGDVFRDSREQSLAVGTFDGLHPGHLAVLKQAVVHARKADLSPAVLTFRPEPELVLTERRPTERRLLNLEDKRRFLHRLGFERVYEVKFTDKFASWDPERFGRWLLDSGKARHVSVGYNFRYGHRRQGSTETLKRQLENAGCRVSIASPVRIDGDPVSSSRIRQSIRKGNPSLATRFMGRPYVIRSTIQAGDGRGKTIGFPTMNLPVEDTIHPRKGVYMVRAGPELEGWGVANFGLRPTVDPDGDPVFEVHLLDPDEVWKPGRRIRVALVEFIRPEEKFSSVGDLVEQITRDVHRARELLEEREPPNWPDLPVWTFRDGPAEVVG